MVPICWLRCACCVPAFRPQFIGADCQLVVICGRNAKLVEKLQNK